MDQAGRGPLAFDGHVEGVQGDLGVQGLAHRPALACPRAGGARPGGSCGCSCREWRRGRANLRRLGCRSGRRARSGSEPSPRSSGPACWARSDSRGGCSSSGHDAAGRPGPVSRRGASAAPRGTDRPVVHADTGWRGCGASHNSRCSRHGSDECPRSVRGWRQTSRSRADRARHNSRWPTGPGPRTSREPATPDDAHEPELHREAPPKMSAAFFRMSRSIRS